MITVYNSLHKYCIEKQLPPPSKADCTNAGRFIGHHFRNYWGRKQPHEIIPDTGFIKQIEGLEKTLVIGYPDIFEPEMMQRFDIFYAEKMERIVRSEIENQPKKIHQEKEILPPTIPPKKRKRIPLPTKEFSVKPSQINE